ncbi:putative F-box/FBD/LRR-repeat protein At5g62970 [Lathyrus oleraceus]|nr:putative F-box/FBD/LRR-repeat protein At5g62970 [Pisum sativum]
MSAMSRRPRVGIQQKEDRLSGLPDVLIDHILSFLPTKDAVATSILSKHWKPFWRAQQLKLYFDDRSFPSTFAFLQFFSSFMDMRDNTLPILSFHLICQSLSYVDFHRFAFEAIMNGVENLTIDLFLPTRLPPLVLTSLNLLVLKLKRVTLNNAPNVELPSLKVLHLESVTFTYHEYLERLVYGCPILEELETKDLRVEIPNMYPPTDISTISNLIRANISDYLIQFEWLHNVEHLHLHLNRNPHSVYSGVFHKLTYLDIIFNFDHEPFAIFKWQWLGKLLQNTPILQTLIIHEVSKVHVDVLPSFKEWDLEREWSDPKIVPECLLSHLTTCSLENYSPINCELRFAKYVMQNSRLLSSMTIQSDKLLDADANLQMFIDLSSCPRISPTCKLLFV